MRVAKSLYLSDRRNHLTRLQLFLEFFDVRQPAFSCSPQKFRSSGWLKRPVVFPLPARPLMKRGDVCEINVEAPSVVSFSVCLPRANPFCPKWRTARLTKHILFYAGVPFAVSSGLHSSIL